MSKQPQRSAEITKDEIQAQIVGSSRAVAKISHHSGPLPAPEQLQKYEEVKAGLADRIVCLAEGEATHRRECERAALQCQIDTAKQESDIVKRGQHCASFSNILAVVGAVICAYNNQIAIGMTLGGISAVSIITAFLKTKNPEPQFKPVEKQELSGGKK
jgi:uncharacterized membrane protein